MPSRIRRAPAKLPIDFQHGAAGVPGMQLGAEKFAVIQGVGDAHALGLDSRAAFQRVAAFQNNNIAAIAAAPDAAAWKSMPRAASSRLTGHR